MRGIHSRDGQPYRAVLVQQPPSFQLSRPPHDDPYRDPSTPKASSSRDRSTRPPRKRRSARKSRPAATPPAAVSKSPPSRRRSRKKRGAGSPSGRLQLTSQPTSRNAYLDTKAWLLEEHGPVCAYCDRKFTAKVMTLDHVAPRRGQTAYDRRDNLVLACPGCNAAKRDQAPLAFLLAVRSRAASLLRYGSHLSPMLLELAKSLAPAANGNGAAENGRAVRESLAMLEDEGESPYRD